MNQGALRDSPPGCTITINGSRLLESESGVSLFEALRRQKIFLPSACGGRGICGFCKCLVTRGGGPLQPAETARLKPEEIRQGFRLACQVRAEGDLDITIPENLFQFREFETEVTEITSLTYDTKRLTVHLIRPERISFKAGQYIQIQSRPYPGVESPVVRSYSIASPSYRASDIELIVRRVPDGICTTWIHDHLRVGERVTMVGPMGDFYLREGDGEIVLVAGGSGLGPMAAILKDMAEAKDPRKTILFFGAVCRKDLYYLEVMEELQAEMPHFTFVPALSNPESCDRWEGPTGLVTVPLEAHLRTRDSSRIQAYLCGSPGMIHACLRTLRIFDIGNDRVFFDPFA
jgi:Na+-transporting NADH:ubiquinone oxidoreductase subunit F